MQELLSVTAAARKVNFRRMETRADRIKAIRKLHKLTQERFAERLGVERGAVGNWELGKGIKTENLAQISDEFNVPLDWIAHGRGPTPGTNEPDPSPIHRPPPVILGERDMPVYAAVEGGAGEMVVSTDPIELVPRPWYMREVRDGYAVLVVGDSMVPVFEPGDIAVVNPRLPPMRGKDLILISNEERGEFRASIKRLVNMTAVHWHLHQFNPPRGQQQDFAWARKDWPKALRVVGKYYGG